MKTDLRDRVKEFRRIPASELRDNTGNWRRHPQAQRAALAGILKEIGIAGALTAYLSDRNDGALVLIDGHLRKSTANVEWPVLILDLTDEEADVMLAAFDPLGAMAEADGEKLRALLDAVTVEDEGLSSLLAGLRESLTDSEVQVPVAPEDFKEYGEDIETKYCCPKCGYQWSGKPE